MLNATETADTTPTTEAAAAAKPSQTVTLIYIGDGSRYVPDVPTETVVVTKDEAARLVATGLYKQAKD